MGAFTFVIAGCGGPDLLSDIPEEALENSSESGEGGDTSGDGSSDPGSLEPGEPAPEASGQLEANTIRIGDQVWQRTLPMTEGQCFLYEDDGTLPTSGVAWGTLDGRDDTSFAARYKQDGSFEADVKEGETVYWGSGERYGEDDLVVELDFDTLTISGHGTFASLLTGDRAMGSFTFTCEPEDQ